MVVAAQQCAGKIRTCTLQPFDLGVEGNKSVTGDWFPGCDIRRLKNSSNVTQRQAGVLEHADKHQSP